MLKLKYKISVDECKINLNKNFVHNQNLNLLYFKVMESDQLQVKLHHYHFFYYCFKIWINLKGFWSDIEHYTQIVQAGFVKVGCGAAKKTGSSTMAVGL